MGDFNIGDYVRVIENLDCYYMAGMKGIIREMSSNSDYSDYDDEERYSDDNSVRIAIEFEDEFDEGHDCDGFTADHRGRWCYNVDEIELACSTVKRSGTVDSIITSKLIKLKDCENNIHICSGWFSELKIGDSVIVKGKLMDNGVIKNCNYSKYLAQDYYE